MKIHNPELAALARAAGVRHTAQEIETAAYLAEFVAVCRRVAETPTEIRMERVQAVKDLIVRPADAEAVRAAYWLKAPLPARMVAVMSARLPKERAGDALNKFDAMERGLIWIALEKLVGQLGIVQKCMQGGRMPSPAGAVH